MNGLRIGDVARALTPLTADETLARAAELLRSAPFGVLPVVANGRLLGVLTQESLGEATQALFEGIASAEEIRLAPLTSVPIAAPRPLLAEAPVAAAVPALASAGGALPVVDAEGRYVGMIGHADVLGVACRAQRPPSIGGMATPLGVYLTTGSMSAGAHGSLGLMLTGAAMGAGLVLTMLLTGFLIYAAEWATGIPVLATLSSTPVGWHHVNRYDIWQHVIPLASVAIFLMLLRLSPLAGYHAAEHQVVHTIERDRPLVPDEVRRMPRAHPRCGTRFAGIGVLFTLFVVVLPISNGEVRYAAAAVAILLGWRVFGYLLQNWITTKPASAGQLRSAISAGEELLAKYRTAEPRRSAFRSRLWHMGLLQVAAGAFLAWSVLFKLLTWWPWAVKHALSW